MNKSQKHYSNSEALINNLKEIEKKEKTNKPKNKIKNKDKDKSPSKKNKNEESDIYDHPRKWIEKPQKKFKSGKITPEEDKKITEALCQYAFENNLSDEELLNLITEKQEKKEKSVWTSISTCLPDRSVQSIHNFCHRKFHPDNYKGFWSHSDEQMLIHLVKEHGKKWELIGKELQRTATNVKDKYKQLGGDNHQLIETSRNLSTKLKLLKAIDFYISDKYGSLFKYTYKFNPNLEKEEDVYFKVKNDKIKFVIDSSLKEEKSKCIIHNILLQLLDFNVIRTIIENEVEISWTTISNNLKILSFDDCKNEWNKILREFNLEENINKRKDLQMVKKLIKLGIEEKDEINWELIMNKRNDKENQLRLDELILNEDIYNVKAFSENLFNIKNKLEHELEIDTMREEKKKENKNEFNEEMKNRKERNILSVYHSFLKKKRGKSKE